MLRRNIKLSKGARNLYTAMLSLADAKTGELRRHNHWFDGRYIDREAEICHVLRKRFMRELTLAGLVRMERIRVVRVIGRRKREVLGPTHYTVFRSSTVNSVNRSRNLLANQSVTHHTVSCSERFFRPGPLPEKPNTQNHHPTTPHQADDDDDSFVRAFDLGNRLDELQNRAFEILVAKTHDAEHDREFVQLALQRIEERSQAAKTVPGSAKYYLTAFETLRANETERNELLDEVLRRRRLRKKYLGVETIDELQLTAEQEARRREFNARFAKASNSPEVSRRIGARGKDKNSGAPAEVEIPS